jgi:hypothetical protein
LKQRAQALAVHRHGDVARAGFLQFRNQPTSVGNDKRIMALFDQKIRHL